jgi:outer membrane protein insertion porin family
MDEDLVRAVTAWETGETFTREKLENTINDLKDWGVFSEAEVLVEFEGNEVSLTYELKEGFIIKDVTIKGNYPLLDSVVRRALFLNAGQVYDPAKLPEQVDRLDKLYDKEGYFQSTVFAIEEYNEAKREVTLNFKIQKGQTYRTRNINIEGNTGLKPKKIRGIIYTFSHYKPRALKKNLEKIQNLYKKKGWVRARVRLAGESYDYDAHKVDLDIAVRQGKRVFVRFLGNDHFMTRVLRKQITVFEDGDFDDYELEASAKRLTQFYQARGYENALVTFEREKLDEENVLVTFNIQEGQQTRVKKIEFSGNTQITDEDLRKIMLSREEGMFEKGYFLKPLVDQDMKLLDDYFQKEGYLDSSVSSWEKEYNEFGDKTILTVNIVEKPRALVNELEVKGLDGAEEKEILPDLILQPGLPYSPSKLEQDVILLQLRLSNVGYPYAEVKSHAENVRDNLWDVSLTVDKGEKVKIGNVLFVGNSLTKEGTIRRNLRFKQGDDFSAQKILQSQINLRRLGIFDGVAIEPLGLANKEKTIHPVVRVQEKKSKIVDLQLGYSTDTGFEGKVVFNKLNMWGSGKNGNIKLQAGQEISRFEVNYIDPRLMGSGLQLVIGAFTGLERRPFFQNFSAGAFSTLYKDLTTFLSAFGRLQFEYVNFDETNTVIDVLRPPQAVQDRTRLKTTLGTIYDRRDNFGRPTAGYYLSGNVTLTDQFIQRSGNYFTLQGSSAYWYTPFSRVTLANILRMAKIFPVPGSTSVPVDDRLYLGGDDTVRGFEQDSLLPTGGLFSMVYNFEMQFNLFNNFQVVGFLDNGVVVNSMDQISLSTLRHSAGPGIRYLTPVGPIRLEYGIKLDPLPGESFGRLHFSFGYFF